ncbi:MAG TPA: hypothetical protein H9725_07650, partial [Candidatus Faecalibacterium gallistercoris]|nr:hypothetical protein [Candidatus Faecalibacterium gallistercoris]
HSARNRLRPVNYSFGIFKCSLHFKRFRYKYSILFNFQGPAFVGRLTGDLLIVAPRGGFVKHFFHLFSSDAEALCSFTGLSAGASRRALAYSTTFSAPCQPLFSTFFGFDQTS